MSKYTKEEILQNIKELGIVNISASEQLNTEMLSLAIDLTKDAYHELKT